MKKLLLTLLCVISFTTFNAQSNKDIANVYIKRANAVIEESIDYEEAKVLFDKAMKYMDTITSSKIAKLGARIHFELQDYKKSITYFEQYFLLVKNKKSEDYTNQVELLITTKEELELQIEQERKLEQERLAKQRELKRIDSLKTVWINKSKSLSLDIDEILDFNKNNVAIFKKGPNYGLIDDKGQIVIEANEYGFANSFDGYVLFSDKEEEPTKIYSYNTNTKIGFQLPKVSDFNPLSTHYGKVMLPRANGRLVMYPNNSYKVLVYDLEEKKVVRVANTKELFKSLKKNDIIRKYNKEGNIRINKDWFGFAGHIGGGIYPITFEKQYKLYGFLCSIDGTVLKTAINYNFLGAFYDGKTQAIKGDETVWVNQNGTKVSEAKNKNGKYTGASKLIKLENGTYQIMENGFIILGNEKLGKMVDFLRENSNN